MLLREKTKYLFAESLKELLKTKDLQKIRVKDICLQCGAERQTFYYHFKDKYDLVSWIYLKDLECSIKESGYFLCETQLVRLLNYIDESRAFYKKVFSDPSQNMLSLYIYQYNVENIEKLLRDRFGDKALTEELRFSVRYHAFAWVGCLAQWAINPPVSSSEAMAAFIYKNIPDILAKPVRGNLLFNS